MKKMLIVGITMSAAGTENSFINFSKHIDYSQWQVDLLLAKREGDFLDLIPKEINVLDMGEDGELFLLSKDNSKSVINRYYQKRPFKMFKLFPTLLGISLAKGEKKTYKKNNLWIKMMKEMAPVEKEYDLAIGYWGDRTLFYVVDKVNSKKKLAWMHFNFPSPPRSPKTYKKYIDRLDRFVAVSDECADSVTSAIPSVKDKVVVFENFIDRERVEELSKGTSPLDPAKYNIVTVGRINYDKGYDVALPAMVKFLEENSDAEWHIVGSGIGSYYENFMSGVKSSSCRNRIVIHGVLKNPYVYIRNADVYLQPSRNESQCMVVEETKGLCKPIIVTRYQTAERQLENGRFGKICDFDSESIFKALVEMKNDKALRDGYINELFKNICKDDRNVEKVLSFDA
ncbi:MAG: glycosyltransferase [Clostridiales bacterium]|nr:glycosyltransferase [Clostridiales bacterium]